MCLYKLCKPLNICIYAHNKHIFYAIVGKLEVFWLWVEDVSSGTDCISTSRGVDAVSKGRENTEQAWYHTKSLTLCNAMQYSAIKKKTRHRSMGEVGQLSHRDASGVIRFCNDRTGKRLLLLLGEREWGRVESERSYKKPYIPWSVTGEEGAPRSLTKQNGSHHENMRTVPLDNLMTLDQLNKHIYLKYCHFRRY